MNFMKPLTFSELQTIVNTYVKQANLSSATFVESYNNVAGLLDTIGKIFTLDTRYIDKLADFNGEELSYGKSLEEWQQDLILPEDYDKEGAGALSPSDPSYRPNFYSFTSGRKKLKTTRRFNEYERAVHDDGQLSSLVTMITKRLYDSKAAWDYDIKREALGKMVELAKTAMTSSTVFAKASTYAVGSLLISAASNGVPGIVFKKYTANAATDWNDAVKKGYIVELDLTKSIAVPTTTETGEAFIEQVKKDVEIASDMSQGHSLNGNCLGASEEGLILFVKQGVMPNIEVKTQAGAFHLDKVAIPCEIRVIKDFGDATDVFALLMDKRGMRQHNTYRRMAQNENGDGDFINFFYHWEDTLYISRNVFMRAYLAA